MAVKKILYTDGYEGFKRRTLAISRKLDRGETLSPRQSMTFDSMADLLAALTPSKLKLFDTVRGTELSINDLVERLARRRSAIQRDVDSLVQVGLLRKRRAPNEKGHGVITLISPAARSVIVRL